MFEQLIWYLKGYVRIWITGYSPERFLNACRYKNIYIWDLKRVCGSYEMNLTIDGFRRLKEIVRKTGTKVCIIRRSGLPFLLHRYRKRHILLSGFLICAGLILFMTRFIWGIDISGNLSYTDDSIEICFSGKTFPAHALFFTVCPDQSADRLHADHHCCLRVMNDRIIHAEGIALLISHNKKIRTTADFQMRSHNKQCR